MKWECILNCCAKCPGTNEPGLESPKQLDRLFPGSLNKINFHIFQHIYKCSTHGLIPFENKNILELWDITQDKEKRENIMEKIVLLLMRKLLMSLITNVIFPQ